VGPTDANAPSSVVRNMGGSTKNYNWEILGISYVFVGTIYVIWIALTENSLLVASAALIIVPLAIASLKSAGAFRRRRG